jgi:transglutaminase-like putative cysteine protease
MGWTPCRDIPVMTLKEVFFGFCCLLVVASLGCQADNSGNLTDIDQRESSQAGDLGNSDSGMLAADPLEWPGNPRITVIGSLQYEVTEQFVVHNNGPGVPDKQNFWIALIRDIPPYQELISTEITPENYELIIDEYGNRYAEFNFSGMPADETIQIELKYRISVNEVTYDITHCEGELPDFFTQPELHVEANNPQIVALSQELRSGQGSTCTQVRAFYDYVGDNLVYSYNGGNWGAQAALGEMGADCSEYSDLMMALSRAAGIPARYNEGLYYPGVDAQAGAQTEHAWLEVYLPGIGWTPLDPTLGRSSQYRNEYFAHYVPNHIILTQGRNPSTLRGGSYWTYIYWPGDSTKIKIEDFSWQIERIESGE